MDSFIPVNEPLLTGNVRKYLNECIDTGWISSEGPFVEKFEEGFAKYLNRSSCIAVTNGTAALELAVKALDIKEGDEIIIPSFTIISCAMAITRAGAVPVLVDSMPDTWNMAVDDIEKKITSKTKAIMVVHIYGLPVDMDSVLGIAQKHGLKIIEDSAESIGLRYDGKPCGGFGDISIFSFYANKHITTGEGGMVATNDPVLAERCRYFRNLCFKSPRFVHEDLGWNFRMTNIQAAIGLAQLEQLELSIERKKAMGKKYTQLLSDIPDIQLPLDKTAKSENVYWVYGLVLSKQRQCKADVIMQKLAERGIGSRPFFWPMHEQPVLKQMGLFSGETYPVSENLARYGFYIPSGIAITDEQIEKVSDVVHQVLA